MPRVSKSPTVKYQNNFKKTEKRLTKFPLSRNLQKFKKLTLTINPDNY